MHSDLDAIDEQDDVRWCRVRMRLSEISRQVVGQLGRMVDAEDALFLLLFVLVVVVRFSRDETGYLVRT